MQQWPEDSAPRRIDMGTVQAQIVADMMNSTSLDGDHAGFRASLLPAVHGYAVVMAWVSGRIRPADELRVSS